MAATSAGALALGYWAKDLNVIRDLLSNSFFKPSEQDVITSIADTIIPRGELYGAVDLGVPIYLLGYFEKCEEPEIHTLIRTQLLALDVKSNEVFNEDFVDCTLDQRIQLLLTLSNSEIEQEKTFFDLMKSQTITGFRTSKEVMTERYMYRIVPGHFYGCIDVTENAVT